MPGPSLPRQIHPQPSSDSSTFIPWFLVAADRPRPYPIAQSCPFHIPKPRPHCSTAFLIPWFPVATDCPLPRPIAHRLITPTLDQASSTPIGPDPTSIHEISDAQLLNSPSLSNIYSSIAIDPAGGRPPGRTAELASAGFQSLKTTLRLVEKVAGAGVYPSTVAGLLGVIDIVEVRGF